MNLTKSNLAEQIAKMSGKTFQYKSRTIAVQQARIDGNKVIIETDGQWLKFPLSSAGEELKNFIPVEETRALALPRLEANQMIEKLQEVVLETIEKLTTNKEYIPQAQAINDGIKLLIETRKVELQAISLMHNLNMDKAA